MRSILEISDSLHRYYMMLYGVMTIIFVHITIKCDYLVATTARTMSLNRTSLARSLILYLLTAVLRAMHGLTKSPFHFFVICVFLVSHYAKPFYVVYSDLIWITSQYYAINFASLWNDKRLTTSLIFSRRVDAKPLVILSSISSSYLFMLYLMWLNSTLDTM